MRGNIRLNVHFLVFAALAINLNAYTLTDARTQYAIYITQFTFLTYPLVLIFPIRISFPVKFIGNGTILYYSEKICLNKSNVGKML